jgi:hypothetical protein
MEQPYVTAVSMGISLQSAVSIKLNFLPDDEIKSTITEL